MRLAVDTGGTFTDLVVEDDGGRLHLFKAPTTPADPVQGVFDVLDAAAEAMGVPWGALLGGASLFIHATTRAINAIVTGTAARTAFLTTQGHPDVLLYREGGRTDPFNFTRPYPEPYVPRSWTYEVPERIGAGGEIVRPLDEPAVVAIARKLRERGAEAVGVCLLWSVVNPVHERRVGELLDEHLPGIPYTLSHALNPILREYRRASSACIDASLKPLMADYLRGLAARLGDVGFRGRTLVVTSGGDVLDAAAVAAAPIHAVKSGPSMAPVAGRHYAQLDGGGHEDLAIVADAGGTTFDVSLVRRGRISRTGETWLGDRFFGHLTGFPSVDVRSIGAGGGSIAWVDEGGLLHVGPQSAGAVPGPACYGRGGAEATVTDACVVLGYLDPDYFLGGAMRLDAGAAQAAIRERVAQPLGLDVRAAAMAVLELVTEHMVRGVEEIALFQGVDPRDALLVGGGGAAGLNAGAIARRLGCPRVIIPDTAAALSAVGALLSDLTAEYATTCLTASVGFDFDRVNAALAGLEERCRGFIAGPGAGAAKSGVELSVEARYPHQAWELEIPLRSARFGSPADVDALVRDFHALHAEVFAIADSGSPIELVTWRARARCRLRAEEGDGVGRLTAVGGDEERAALAGACITTRDAYFAETGLVPVEVYRLEAMAAGMTIRGPAIVESASTTVVVPPGVEAVVGRGRGLVLETAAPKPGETS